MQCESNSSLILKQMFPIFYRNRGRGRGRNERSQGHLTHGRDNSSKHKDGRGRDRVLDKTQKFINHGSSSSAVKASEYQFLNLYVLIKVAINFHIMQKKIISRQ